MKNKLISRLSNGFGNQMFIYASSYSFAKQLNYEFFLDIHSAINQVKENKFKHYKPQYELFIFNLTANILPRQLTFDSYIGYLRRKLLIFLDKFTKKKRFIIEKKDNFKKTYFNNLFLNDEFNHHLYIEGYFESEKYFSMHRSELLNEFSFKKNIQCSNNYLDSIVNSNSVSLAMRRDRFSETFNDDKNINNLSKTKDFENAQYDYIINAINYFKKNIKNPKFFLFSDNFDKLESIFSSVDNLTFVKDYLTNKVSEDFFLMSKCKHFVVAPTTFHWWAAWLNNSADKICLRPSNDFLNPSNNLDFWPKNWIEI